MSKFVKTFHILPSNICSQLIGYSEFWLEYPKFFTDLHRRLSLDFYISFNVYYAGSVLEALKGSFHVQSRQDELTVVVAVLLNYHAT